MLAEHGGFNENETHVPLMLTGPSIVPGQVRAVVTTTQIAPTILTLLGLDPTQLTAVKVEGVKALPAVTVKKGDDNNQGDDNGNGDHGNGNHN